MYFPVFIFPVLNSILNPSFKFNAFSFSREDKNRTDSNPKVINIIKFLVARSFFNDAVFVSLVAYNES